MFSFLNSFKIDDFLIKSLLFIGDYFKYVLLIVPVGFFINVISAEKLNTYFMFNFYIYLYILVALSQKYDSIRKDIIGNNEIDYNLIRGVVRNKHVADGLYLYLILSFIMSFGYFIENNLNILFSLFFILSIIYFTLAIKLKEFSSFFIYMLLFTISVYTSLFYALYASVFLYIALIIYSIKKTSHDDELNLDIRSD